MNASLLPEVLLKRRSSPHAELPLATEGGLRYLWEGKFGPMLIEVRAGRVFVNGDAVVAE